jgi:hypothetical protein
MRPVDQSFQLQPPTSLRNPFGWPKIFGYALLLTFVSVAVTELVWRKAGHFPTVYNTPSLWAYHRRRLIEKDPEGVAVLGSSRMLAAFSTDRFRRRYPRRLLAQLAIQGSSPFRAFEDLAMDPDFRGTVICECLEAAMVAANVEQFSYHEYLDEARRGSSKVSTFDLCVAGRLQERLCCFYPELSLNHQLRNRIELNRWQETRSVFMHFDRRQLVDYSLVDVAQAKAETLTEMKALLAESLKTIPSPDEWLRQALAIEPAVKSLQARRGRVVFVVLPCTGAMWDLEQRLFPKDKYWDRFAAATSAITIHFRDVPTLAATPCPDNFHLDFREADQFTDRLIDELVARGALDDAAGAH